jgi:hypothetical protein
MKYAILFLVAVSLLGFAGGAVAPGVCISAEAGLNAIVAFASDPQPDLIIGPGGLVDGAFC